MGRDDTAAADREPTWPAHSWSALRQAGVLGWCIGREHGGQGWDDITLLEGYERLAGACLTTAFLLSQREAACRRLRVSDRVELAEQLLPALARGETFATVGLSQLTTSRQHLASIVGSVPHPYARPSGCPFYPRCASFMAGLCDQRAPTLQTVAANHDVSCFLHGEG